MNSFDKQLIEKYVSENQKNEALKKLESGYPVQYIIGNVEFYNLIIDVNENVLIPRFETEYLVDDLIKLINKYNVNGKILEIGTGTGCIAIALKKNLNLEVDAIDISKKAINVAQNNAIKNNAEVNFINQSIEEFNTNNKYSVLVSNPPYVSLSSPVDDKIKYEPQNAIYAPENGLYFYRIILEKSVNILDKKNIIAFEIGDKQASDIVKIAKKYYPNANYIIKKDLNNYERYIYIINE